MTEKYVEEDNIKLLLTEYSNWRATTAIPKYFDAELNINSTLFINTSTLKNCLIMIIIMLKDKFRKHCAWEEPKWISRMK